MRNLPTVTFNSGYLSPLIEARQDIDKYGGGCRAIKNMIPLVYGPAMRRPGTKYVNSTRNSSKKARLLDFIYSSSIAYQVEMGEGYARFYYDGAVVRDGYYPVEITTDYLEDELPEIQTIQSADVMWILHPNHPPKKLSRVSATSFTLEDIVFENGPFLTRNDIENNDGVTLTVHGLDIATATAGATGVGKFTIESDTDISANFPPNRRFYVSDSTGNDGAYTVHATTLTTYIGTTLTVYTNETISDGTDDGEVMVKGGTGTMVASSDLFQSGHAGSIWKLTQKRIQTITSGSKSAPSTGQIGDAIDAKGTWSCTSHGHWISTFEIQRMEDGTNWETFRTYVGNDDRNIQKSEVENTNDVQYRIYVTENTSGTISVDFTVDESTQDGIVRIDSVTNSKDVNITFIVPFPSVTPTYRWCEGSWSDVRGYPKSAAFFEERVVYAFTDNEPSNVWFSKSGDFENFEYGVNDNDAFSLLIPSSDEIQWINGLDALIVGTSGGEWRIRSTAIDEALTPTNFSVKQQTSYGSKHLGSLVVSNAILFCDFVGRKIREVAWSDDQQKYVAPDLTALAENLTEGIIGGYAYQRNPESIVWIWLEEPVIIDGDSISLLSITYNREQNVVAFSYHDLGGQVESVCVTPSREEDLVTFIVKRTINDQTVRYIEQLQPFSWGTSKSNCYFVDCGLSYNSTPTNRFRGLEHLEGETVTVLGDGAVFADQVVTNGRIQINGEVSVCHVGKRYEYKLDPMLLDLTPGVLLGMSKLIPEVYFSFYKTGGANYGDGINTYDIPFRTTESYDTPPVLFTGFKLMSFDSGFTTDDHIIISGSDPLPCTVRAIIPRTEVV